ncbi:hypothetical protein [Citromicrobium sp. WPS32]|uniref:hypothetical protein n=1 Tax=Citromicrobium sp. WPS32 TaxID=1634517 RepID=UPI0006C8FC8F|nr:hypothetical protein [Citromicrobium sp. WPS32]KPM12551.1 hypothetical protein WG75_14440 [Citromicrobium sp. WPS32]MAY76251.1 hypothetical protein [Citromicrobium sp.]|tara:strand:- start:3145 stop:3660 length:516 start_codon:yes stop_codon:yes gene_type:complete
MDRLEILAHAEVADASRDLLAMQAIAREVLTSDAPRLAPLARTLRRDLDAAINGTAAPWTTTRTRLEARKLGRLATSRAPQPAPLMQTRAARPAANPSDERNELLHVGAALTALALWLAWAAQLSAQNAIAWDGGTGPAQTQNLVSLYAPAVLALLATLIAINPPNRVARP